MRLWFHPWLRLLVVVVSLSRSNSKGNGHPHDGFLLERAEKEIEKEGLQETLDGASSPKVSRKKVTPLSIAMSKRNSLFKKSMDILALDGLGSHQAKNTVNEALAKRAKRFYKNNLNFTRELYNDLGAKIMIEEICTKANITCDPSSKFRSINGQCNNLGKPYWGSASTPYERILPGISQLFKVETFSDGPTNWDYSDNITDMSKVNRFGVPKSRCSCKSSKECVEEAPVRLPNARFVSRKFFTEDIDAEDNHVTHLHTQFGQFLDHDLVMTPEEDEHDCCRDTDKRPSCFPIDIPQNDDFYQSYSLMARGHNQTCLDHSRSTGYCSQGFEDEAHEQFNGITSFVDASNVYGSTNADSLNLRKNDGSGRLKADRNFLLPKINKERTAGDTRAIEMPGLAAMHTIFLREHNSLCDALRNHPDVDSSWEDEDYFQNARRILIALMQKIVYAEYLPIVLSRKNMILRGLVLKKDTEYFSDVNPTHFNSFGAAAFRFGHSMIQGLIGMFKDMHSKYDEYALSHNFNNLSNYELANGKGMEMIITGMMAQKAQANDRHVSEQVTNKLFVPGNMPSGVGGDLMARNIQRGRDHGLPSYAAFYKHLHKIPAHNHVLDCWSKKPKEISRSNWDLLKRIYNHPHHIDLWVGGMAEKPYKGGITGRTFQNIIGQTFANLKNGDRFFFTHKGNMNSAEYNQIMSRTLGDIICDNFNQIKGVALDNVFLVNSPIKICGQRTNKLDIKAFNVFKVNKGKW